MHNTYLILRNNKELGPYSLEQLLELSVQPNDLIWVEGQSASWCYPADIPSLKTYFAPQATPPAETKTVAEKPAGTASHIYVRLPANTMPPVFESNNTGDSIEKKAEEIYQRVQAFAQQKQQQQAAGEPEIGYTRSLTDLKEDYAAWYHKSKKKEEHRKLRNKVLVAAMALLVITSGFTFTTWLRPSKLTAQKVKLEALSATVKNTDKKALPALSKKPAAENATAIVLSAPPDALRPAAKPKTTINKFNNSSANNLVLTIPRAAVITPQAPKPELIENPMPRTLPLWQLISVNGQPVKNKNGNYITGMQVTVQNNSTQIVKKVTVHIYYYKNDDHLFEKQDLSFTNLQPKSTLTLPSQAGKKATTARFEVGAITRDDGSLYVK